MTQATDADTAKIHRADQERRAFDNYPILWQNVLPTFKTEIGRKAWIWFAETRGTGMLYDADRYANEVEWFWLILTPMVEASAWIYTASGIPVDSETISDLMRFILTRHANWRLGGNVAPSFLAVAQ